MAPLQTGAALFPAAALRADLGVVLTSARFMGPQAALTGLAAPQLTGPFGAIVDQVSGAVRCGCNQRYFFAFYLYLSAVG